MLNIFFPGVSVLTIHFWDSSSIILGVVICFDSHILKWKPFGLAEMKQVDECVPAYSQMDFYLY